MKLLSKLSNTCKIKSIDSNKQTNDCDKTKMNYELKLYSPFKCSPTSSPRNKICKRVSRLNRVRCENNWKRKSSRCSFSNNDYSIVNCFSGNGDEMMSIYVSSCERSRSTQISTKRRSLILWKRTEYWRIGWKRHSMRLIHSISKSRI